MVSTAAMFPLGNAFLPGERVALRIFEPRYLAMVHDIQSTGCDLCTVLIERGSEVGGSDSRMTHGVRLDVQSISRDGDDAFIDSVATQLVSVVAWDDDDPYPRALVDDQQVSPLDPAQFSDAGALLTSIAAEVARMLSDFSGLPGVSPQTRTQTQALMSALRGSKNAFEDDQQLWRFFWLVARAVPSGALDRYELLRPGPLPERIARLSESVGHVAEILAFRTLDE